MNKHSSGLYNGWKMPKIDEGAAYAKGLSQRVKSYVDVMLGPFLRTRVQIFIGKVEKINKKTSTMSVTIKGNKYQVIMGANNPPNIKKYPHVRILFDSRTKIMYYDDVMPEAYATGKALQ